MVDARSVVFGAGDVMECKKARLDNEPLWLTVTRDGMSESYEFPPGGDDTTVVVGSSDRVQIRVAGAAPIAFYVERVENELCITSCYLGSDLCIDGRVVSGRRTIVGGATVELAGVRLVLAVRDNPPTLPGYYVECVAEPDHGENGATSLMSSPIAGDPSGACSTLHQKPSENASDLNSAVFDTWFEATFLGAAKTSGTVSKHEELPDVRSKPVQLKQVTVPPRPRPTARRPCSDFAQTQELERLQLLAIADELKTVELGLESCTSNTSISPSSEGSQRWQTVDSDIVDSETVRGDCDFLIPSSNDAPTQRAIRIGPVAVTTPELALEPVVKPTTTGAVASKPLLPMGPPRRRPVLFIFGAALGAFIPTLCLVGVGQLAVLSKSESGSRTLSTHAAANAASRSPPASGASKTERAEISLPRTITSTASASSANRGSGEAPQLKKRSTNPAGSRH
ncbi:MAG TPA: hypothetical protein VKP30_33320 [Polyangiaceae bacterium]|nr:hypothetical protein [Polyangiaceae bacterium]